MEIHLGVKDGMPYCYIPKKELKLTDLEEQFIESLFHVLSKDLDLSILRLDKRSDAYTTICCSDEYLSDFLRFKLTDRTKWFSVAISVEDSKLYKEDNLFKDQKNKRERYWKVKMKNINDFVPYIQIIKNAIKQQLSYE